MRIIGFRSKKPWKMILSGSVYAFFIMVIVIAIIDPSTEETTAEVNDVAAEEIAEDVDGAEDPVEEEPIEELSEEEIVSQIVNDNLGEENVDSITINDYPEDVEKKVILLTLNAKDNFTSNMIKGGIHMNTLSIVEDLVDNFAIQEVAFKWQFPMVDQYGNEDLGEVMRINLYGDTLEKINFDNIMYDNIPNIADEYWAHPSFNN